MLNEIFCNENHQQKVPFRIDHHHQVMDGKTVTCSSITDRWKYLDVIPVHQTGANVQLRFYFRDAYVYAIGAQRKTD